jgi:glycosyltransferase involved in cell wall biosynthesis
MSAPHLLFVVNSDWFFLSHRLPVALAAQKAGYDVSVAAIDTGHAAVIRAHGMRFEPLALTHCGTNPLTELLAVFALVRLYRRMRPDLVHHVTIKPVLYGSLAARLVGGIAIVNAVPGLGYIFSGGGRARLLRPFVKLLYRFAFGGPRVRAIFQNPDDWNQFVAARAIEPEKAVLIRGSGVDLTQFKPVPEPDGPPIVMLASRLIWAKGIREFVVAAELVRRVMPDTRFVLVGRPDVGNPTSVDEDVLRRWHEDGLVEWWGHRNDMPAVLAQAALFVLPTTYREGVPRALIEAAAAGRPIITTDAPGCREIVEHLHNGVLVPPRDAGAVAAAILSLLESPALRKRYGAAGRVIAANEFGVESVVGRTLALYAQHGPVPTPRTTAVAA